MMNRIENVWIVKWDVNPSSRCICKHSISMMHWFILNGGDQYKINRLIVVTVFD